MEMYKECLTPLPHDLLQVFQEPQLAQEASLRAENFTIGCIQNKYLKVFK